MFVGSVCCDLSLATQECAGYKALVEEEGEIGVKYSSGRFREDPSG